MDQIVIGSEGFHVFIDKSGFKQMIVHDGMVKIGAYVSIGASVNIDKGLMGRNTLIENECKFDNLVHVAHRVIIGKGSTIAAKVCFSGSVTLGENVWIGPSATISNRINIGAFAKVLLGSVVIRNIKAHSIVSGNFARSHEKHLREYCN